MYKKSGFELIDALTIISENNNFYLIKQDHGGNLSRQHGTHGETAINLPVRGCSNGNIRWMLILRFIVSFLN